MPKFLKEGISQAEKDDADAKVRKIVEDILENIKSRGDDALLEYSNKFDNWAPDRFQLSRLEIDKCYEQVTKQNIIDIKFAQTQVRGFAQIQKKALVDVEQETLPGVILGHKNIPVNSVGCYNIESHGRQIIEKIEGSYYAILGVPLVPLYRVLRSIK